ncbi:MAG TPA: ribonuclease P protein component [Saprospiraceae bacterium]|nr:ribonuclease P protein component [Saprospiraceae bacterium]HNT20365.1 ribonuclease P protein component [Saprospiraceae bacterium]
MAPEEIRSGSNRFPPREKLKSRKSIQVLFDQGKSFSIPPLRIIFLIHPTEEAKNQGVRFAISVPKKIAPLATRRNRIKRLIREAYRLGKTPLIEACRSKGILLEMMWIFNGNPEKTDFGLLRPVAAKAINKLISFFSRN